MYNSICCQLVNFYLQNNYKNKMKQTAVEFLVSELLSEKPLTHSLIEKARKFEKQHIIDASMINLEFKYPMISKYRDMAEQYYLDKFK